MAIVYIASPLAGDGKSVLAVGLAAAFQAEGRSVQLVRLAGGANEGPDATTFALVRGVRTTGHAVDLGASEIEETNADLVIVEVPNNETLTAARSRAPAQSSW